jgi:hypothetical protein
MPDLVEHRPLAALGGVERCAGDLRRFAGALGHVVDLRRHLQHLLAGVLDLLRLRFGRRQQPRGDVARLGRCGVDLLGGVVDPADQAAQLLDRVVDRVGDGAGDVLRHGGLHGQVAVGHFLQFVHQPQNRGLVLLVGALGVLLEPLRLHALTDRHRPPAAGVVQQHLDHRERGQQQRRARTRPSLKKLTRRVTWSFVVERPVRPSAAGLRNPQDREFGFLGLHDRLQLFNAPAIDVWNSV